MPSLPVAFRSLARTPAFTATAVATLALGIGLATAVYTVADALLLRPLPVVDQDRVVLLWGARRDGQMDRLPLLLDEARDFARAAGSLERVALYSRHDASPVSVRSGTTLVQMRRALVSGDFFPTLGARVLIGRTLTTSDDVVGAAPSAVLSYGGWQRLFGGDSGVIGRRITLHETGATHTVVGVMPKGLDFPRGTDFWAPIVPSSGPVGEITVYAEVHLVGRLRASRQPADAAADLTTYFGRPEANEWQRSLRGVVHTLPEAVLGNVRPALLAFIAAASLLLLITCINVATLLLVRGRERVREVAVWLALGADRSHLVGRLLGESALLAAAGGALGIGLAWLAVRAFVATAPRDLPRLDGVALNGPAVVAASIITTVVTLLVALAPALAATRVDLTDALRAGSRQLGGSRRQRLVTEGLVVGQLALALVVLSAAGVITRSVRRLERVDLAFAPSQIAVADLSLPDKNQVSLDNRPLVELLLTRLRALPGVQGVTPVLMPPFIGAGFEGQLVTPEQTADNEAANPILGIEVVAPDYFRMLGVRILAGRAFTDGDREGAPTAVILSASAARHYWPATNPVGRSMNLGIGGRGVTVVGVVPDTRYRDLRDPRPSVYFAMAQAAFPVTPTTLILRLDASAGDMTSAVRRVIREVDSRVDLASLVPFETLRAAPMAQPRLNALLLTAFATAAAALAALGLFAVMATMVRQRRREFGVRMALGATRGSVLSLVMRRGLAIAALGAAGGLVGAVVSNRFLQALLFEVSPTDGATLSAMALTLLALAALATLLSARAGTRTDPMVVLRAE